MLNFFVGSGFTMDWLCCDCVAFYEKTTRKNVIRLYLCIVLILCASLELEEGLLSLKSDNNIKEKITWKFLSQFYCSIPDTLVLLLLFLFLLSVYSFHIYYTRTYYAVALAHGTTFHSILLLRFWFLLFNVFHTSSWVHSTFTSTFIFPFSHSAIPKNVRIRKKNR